MTALSVVIPAYNEQAGIEEIIKRVLAEETALKRAGIDGLELLVVDDGSHDETSAIAAEIPGVTLIRHPQNRGYGAALKTGFDHSTGDFIGFLDADGTYPPEYFPELCKVAIGGVDLVIGSRMAGAESRMPLTRRAGNYFFARLLSLVGRQTVTDSASGMRVFRREILSRIYPLPDGLNLTPVMSTRAIHEGISMAEVPIPYSERIGRSKLSVIRDGSLFLRSMLWTALEYNPVRLLGLTGLAGIALGALSLGALVTARLSGVTELSSWAVVGLYAGAVAGMVGVNLFVLGAMFNYLVGLFRGRPVQQGLFGRPIFSTPLESHFGWLGLTALFIGLAVGAVLIIMGVQGWAMTRLWLYGLGSAMLILLGSQLLIYWLVIHVLDELNSQSIREARTSTQTKPSPERGGNREPTVGRARI